MQRQEYPISVSGIAYSGLLFFWGAVKRQLESDFSFLSEKEKAFVAYRCQVGNWLLFGVVGFGLLFRGAKAWWSEVLMQIALLVLAVVITGLVVGSGLIALQLQPSILEYPLSAEQKSQLLKLFLPRNATKSRLQSLSLGKPVRRAKEAEVWLGLMIVIGIVDPMGYGLGVVLLARGVRLGMLWQGKDLLDNSLKSQINSCFFAYIEEGWLALFALIKGREASFQEYYCNLQQQSWQVKWWQSGWWRWILLVIGCGLGVWSWWLWRKLIPAGLLMIRSWSLGTQK